MKKISTILLALSLAVAMGLSSFTSSAYAAGTSDSANQLATAEEEKDTKQDEDTSDTEESDSSSNLPDTGAAYDLTGMSGSPDVTAESAIVMDARSGEIIYSKQADAQRYPASITKVMTALLAIENCNMDDIVTFSDQAVNGIEAGSSSAGINVGAELTVEDTLYALMLVSANEAGAALAEHISGSDKDFGKLMTKRAKELGCKGTHFTNPHGLPDEDHYTTAYDMGLILKEAIKHEEFRKISSTITYTLESDTLTQSIELWNHAKILRENSEYYYKYAVGAKTGFTQAALNTLVTYAEKDGVQLLCVILKDYGADQSYYDTTHLYKWAFDQVKSIKPLKDYDVSLAISELTDLSDKEIESYQSLEPTCDTSYPILVKSDFDTSSLSKELRIDEDTETGRLGYIDIKDGDTLVYSAEVTYDTTSDAAQTYLKDKDDSDKKDAGDTDSDNSEEDDLKTATTVTKASLLRSVFFFLLRLVIACLLIFLIMQMIYRWQLAQQRKKRIQNITKKASGKKKQASAGSSTKKTVRKAPAPKSATRSSSAASKSANSNSRPAQRSGKVDSNGIRRNRRHK